MVAEKKKSKGREKVKMKKTEEERRLLVTFSKLRFGLFKKASELCTLCGAEVAIVVFSPYQRAFSFGHPDFDTVTDRFLTANPQMMDHSAAGSSSITPVGINLTRIIDLNEALSGYLDLVQEEKNKDQWLDLLRSSQPKVWWEDPIEELTQEQLEELKEALGLLEANVIEEAKKFETENSNPDPIPGINSLGGALPMDNNNINNPIELDSDDQINPMSNSGIASSLLEAHRNANVRDLNLQLTQDLGDLEAEKRRAKMLNQMRKFTSQMRYSWEGPIEELDSDQLEQLKGALEDLKKKSKNAKDKLLIEGSSSNPFLGVNPSAAHGLGLDSHHQDHLYYGSNGQHFGYGSRGFR